jgi:U3 small nucleolar RNA-associated protein 25
VRSYLDFVRVRNALTKAEVSFCVNSEYTDLKNGARARSLFADGRKRVLLVTERAHFYHRRRIRGVREVFFYSLPDREKFYSEMVSFLGDDASDADGTRLSAPTANVAFSAYDALQLERVVGSKRAKKMLAPDANSTFIFT